MNASAKEVNRLLANCGDKTPFLLENEGEYQAWRTRKLKLREALAPIRAFELDESGRLPQAQFAALEAQIEAYNFILFESRDVLDKPGLLALNRQLGLHRLDANLGADDDKVTSLQVVGDDDERAQYIPYTNRAMNWHTDGYYNSDGRRINAFALYCVHPAERGGGNSLFDHEYMYLLIRDTAPDLLEALMRRDMMRIPANVQGNQVIRAEETGPVFLLDRERCALTMRYTSRPRNIVWKSDKRSERALNLIREILMDDAASIEIDLRAGQGLVCNNILHGRQAFHDASDGPARLVYRARYLDAIDPIALQGED